MSFFTHICATRVQKWVVYYAKWGKRILREKFACKFRQIHLKSFMVEVCEKIEYLAKQAKACDAKL